MKRRPNGGVVSTGRIGMIKPGFLAQQGVELRLQGANGNVPAVRALVGPIEGSPTIDPIGLSVVTPPSTRREIHED